MSKSPAKSSHAPSDRRGTGDVRQRRDKTRFGAARKLASVPKAASSKTAATDARRFAIGLARLAADTRCHSVVVLDVAGLSPVCDYFVIASGTSARQMGTVIQDAMELAAKHDYPSISSTGRDGASWALVDFVDVVFHVFTDEARRFYDLDNLWGDARRVEWKE